MRFSQPNFRGKKENFKYYLLRRLDPRQNLCGNFVAICYGTAEINCLEKRSTAEKHKPFGGGRQKILLTCRKS